MAEELNNVQHNLNADVDISFDSGIESILKFAEQVESVNNIFSKLSFTAENLEDKIVRKFNELGNLLNDAQPITDVNTAVAKKIQQKINRYISQYVENLDFSAGIKFDSKQFIDTFNKNFIAKINDTIKNINTTLDSKNITASRRDAAQIVVRNLTDFRDKTRHLYEEIFKNSIINEDKLRQLEAVKDEAKSGLDQISAKGVLIKPLRELSQLLNKSFEDIISNYKKTLEASKTALGDEVIVSKTTIENLQRKIKQAILDSLDVKFGAGALNINIDKNSFSRIQKLISEKINKTLEEGTIEIGTVDVGAENRKNELKEKIGQYNKSIESIEKELIKKQTEMADLALDEDPFSKIAYDKVKTEVNTLKNTLSSQKETRKNLTDELSNLQINVQTGALKITNENIKKYWDIVQNKFGELLAATSLEGLGELKPIQVDKIKQVIDQISETVNKAIENLKLDKETLSKTSKLNKSIEKFNKSITEVVDLLSDLGDTFTSKPAGDFKKSLTKVNDALIGVKQQIDKYVIDYINKIVPSNLFEVESIALETNVPKKVKKSVKAEMDMLQQQISELEESLPLLEPGSDKYSLIVNARNKLLSDLEKLKASTGEEALLQVDKVKKMPLISKDVLQKFVEKFSQELESLVDVSKVESLNAVKKNIETLNKNFKKLDQSFKSILVDKETSIDKEILVFKSGIEEIRKNFESINALLKTVDVGGIQTAISAFENTLKSLSDVKVKKRIKVDIDSIIENLNKNLKALQQEIHNSDNGITAARIVVDGINQKIEQFVKSLMALSSKIINVDAATINIKLTPEQLQSLEAQLEGVKIVNVSEISGPINIALKNLLNNTGKIIESQLSNIISQEDIKIPKLQINKMISQLTALIDTFMNGYVNAVAENSLMYKPFEVVTKNLPQNIKESLAKKAGLSLEEYLKKTPVVGGAAVLTETVEQNMNTLYAKLHAVTIENERGLFNEYKNAIKGVQVKVDTSPIEYFTNNIVGIQQEIVAKIKEIMQVQFAEINKFIKEIKAVPLGFNYVPTNAPSTKPSKANVVQSYGAKVTVPRGNVNIPIPYRIGDDLDFTALYQKAGGLGSYINNRTLLNSILNTIRYILAGSLLKGPYAYLYQGWESAKTFEAYLEKARINLQMTDDARFKEFATTRIEKAVELGVTNAFSHLKGITDTETLVNTEMAYIRKYIDEDVTKDLQNMALRYIIPPAQLGKVFEIASRSTADPFEARAITEAAARIAAAEPDIGSPEEIADALQASLIQFGMGGFDAKRLSEILYTISTNFRVSTSDLLKFTANAGAVMANELKNYQTEELTKLRKDIELATGDRKEELEKQYKQVKMDTDIALTGLIGALITEGSNKTGTEAARMVVQFFNSLNTPETQEILENIATNNPKYANILPYKYTSDLGEYPYTTRTSGIESFFSILRLADEMEAKGDAKLAGEMLRKVFGRYIGAGASVNRMIDVITQRFPEYRKEGKDPIQGLLEDFRTESESFMDQAILKNSMTLSKRTQVMAVTWETAMSNVFMQFKDDISYSADIITGILKTIRDNAEFVSTLIRQLINVLIGAGVRHFGGKFFEKANASVLAAERDILVEPWKQTIKENIEQRAKTQKTIMDYDEKLSKALKLYDSARQKYSNLTGINLENISEQNQPQFTKKSVKEILNTSDTAVERALLALYSRQTDSEKASQYTVESNYVGFNMFDAKILSRLAEKIQSGEKLSPEEVRKARQRLLKYSGQLSEFGPELFDLDSDIALVTGQSTGDGGIIGRLKDKAAMLEENLQMYKNADVLLNAGIERIPGILPRSKDELLSRANRFMQGLESLVDEDEDIVILKQLLEAEPEGSEDYNKLLDSLRDRRKQVAISLGLPRLREAFAAYESNEMDFESAANQIREFEENLQKMKSGIPVDRHEAEADEQENFLRLKALREAYLTLYGSGAEKDKAVENVNRRIYMSQKRLEQLRSGKVSGSEIEQFANQLKEMKQFNITEENYTDMLETLNQIKAAIVMYEDEAEKILNKATRAASTVSSLSAGKAGSINQLAKIDTVLAEAQGVVKNIIEAYSNMGATNRAVTEKVTAGSLKDIKSIKDKFIKTVAELAPTPTNTFVGAVNVLTDKMFGKKWLNGVSEEQVKEALSKAIGGDYTEADKLFGERSKTIVSSYKDIDREINAADKLVKNLEKQKRIMDEIAELRAKDELKDYADYISDKGDILEQKFYTDKVPEYTVDTAGSEKIEKQIKVLKVELDSLSKTKSGQKLAELKNQLNALSREAEKLASASRMAAKEQAKLSDTTKRLAAEREAGVIEDSEFIEKLKRDQNIEMPSSVSLFFGNILSSIGSFIGNMALNWAIGTLINLIGSRISQAFRSETSLASERHAKTEELAKYALDLMANKSVAEDYKKKYGRDITTDYAIAKAAGSSLSKSSGLSKEMKDYIGSLDKLTNTVLLNKIKGFTGDKTVPTTEALNAIMSLDYIKISKILSDQEKELTRMYIEEEKLNAAVDNEIFKKLDEAVKGKNYSQAAEEARSMDVQNYLDYIVNRFVTPQEREINFKSALKKLELKSEGFRDTSEEMINVEVETAKELAQLYEAGAESLKKRIDELEKEAAELGISVNTETFLKLKESYMELKEKAVQARSIVDDVFSQLSKLFTNIESNLNNTLLNINISDIEGKLSRWKSGIPEYAAEAVNQQIESLQNRIIEYRKAEEEERKRLAELNDENKFSSEYRQVKERYESIKSSLENFKYWSYNLPSEEAEKVHKNLEENMNKAEIEYKSFTEDEKTSELYKDLEAKYKSTVEKLKQAEYDLVTAMQQLPISSAETFMNLTAATADAESRIALAKAQLKGLGEDSLYARLIQKQRLEKINEAYSGMIAALNEQYNKGQGDIKKIWVEIKDLEAKQLENLVAIKKLNENKVTFNLPDGLRVITYNDYLQSIGNERSFTTQFKAFNLNVTFGDVTVRSDNDIKNIVRSIANQIPAAYKNGVRIR